MFAKRIANICEKPRVRQSFGIGRDCSWYDLKHTLKAWDVLSDTQYNTSTIVRDGDHDCSWEKTANVLGGNRERSQWESRTFLVESQTFLVRSTQEKSRDPNFLIRT
jgi:hypothetical protein